MSQYKLTYFNSRGNAEVARYLFALADAKYDDVRLTPEEWVKVKPDAPFGQLPIMETEGVIICQTKAINNYLANKFGLVGNTPLDKARVDMIGLCFGDIMTHLMDVYKADDEAQKAKITKKAKEEQIPDELAKLENILKANKGGDGYFVGDSLTLADLYLVDACGWLEFIKMEDPLANTPKLKALNERVLSNPKIAAWVAKRPKTDM